MTVERGMTASTLSMPPGAAGSPAERGRLPTRRELLRLGVAAGSLILVMTLALGLDLSPGIDLQAGDLVQNDIRAPRALTFTNDLLTQQARQEARDQVPFQYDFSTERAIAIAGEQLAAFDRRVTPLDNAFSPDTTPEDRAALLEAALPGLSSDARTVLLNMTPDRWGRSAARPRASWTSRNASSCGTPRSRRHASGSRRRWPAA